VVEDSFIEQVKQALEDLYDFPALQRHPLAQGLSKDGEPAAHQLRREIIAAIESLNPGRDIAARSGPARLYNLMHLHYVGGMTLQETANELGISLRQAYRDLRRGQEGVSEILWFNRQQQALPPTNAADVSSVQAEVSRLEGEISAVDINGVLRSALKAVERLADQKELELIVHLPDDPITISTNPTVAQQIFISLLSQGVQNTEQNTLQITLSPVRDGARLTLAQSGLVIPPVVDQLVKSLGWHLSSDDQVILRTGKQNPTILIIDDNEGLIELLERYVSSETYQVLSALTGEEGLKLARQLQPDAIVMDLMMPGMDGWELLQYLRTDADTRTIPVIICSVINDPELAYSLGASLCIAKPVNKETILQALKELKI